MFLHLVEAEDLFRCRVVLDIDVNVTRAGETGVVLNFAICSGFEVVIIEGEGEATILSVVPDALLGGDTDARDADVELFHERLHVFEGWGGVHTVEGTLGHALLDTFANRREEGEIAHP